MSESLSVDGVTYDPETGVLTIETDGDWGDIDLPLLRHPESITGLAVFSVAGGRVERGYDNLRRITVRRRASQFTPVEGGTPQA